MRTASVKRSSGSSAGDDLLRRGVIKCAALISKFGGGDRRLGDLFRGSATVMAVQIAGIGLAYAMQVMVARSTGAAEFGVFAYSWTWMNLIFLVASLGMNESALRHLPACMARQQWPEVRGLVVRGPMVVLLAGGILASIGVGVVLTLGDLVAEHYRLTLLITFAATPVFGLLAFLQGVGRAQGSALTAFLPRYIGLPAAVLVAAAGSMILGIGSGATQLVAVTAVAGAVLVAVQMVILVRNLPAPAKSVEPVAPAIEWLRSSMPFLFIAICFGLLTHCDLLAVGLFLSPDQVAVYQAASRTAALISFPLFAVNALVAPMIARLHAEGRQAELQRCVTMATQMVFWPSFVGALVVIAGGHWVLGMFGGEFEAGRTALAILAVGHLFNVGCGPVSYLMTMTGHQDRCAAAWAFAVVLQATLMGLLIPRLGIEGAALASTVTTAFLSLSLTLMVRHRLHISTHALVPVCSTLAKVVAR